jgi:hypothetical protein
VIPTATATQALTANTAIITPFYLDRTLALTSVGAIVTTAAASQVVKLAVYKWNPVTRALGELVKDCGQIATDATGVVMANVQHRLEPGWYAWAVVSGGTPTLRSFSAAMAAVAGAFTVATTNATFTTHYTAAVTAASAWPTTGPAVTAVTSTSVLAQLFLAIATFNASNPAP